MLFPDDMRAESTERRLERLNADLAAAAGRAGDEEIAVFATAMGVALQRIWLA